MKTEPLTVESMKRAYEAILQKDHDDWERRKAFVQAHYGDKRFQVLCEILGYDLSGPILVSPKGKAWLADEIERRLRGEEPRPFPFGWSLA